MRTSVADIINEVAEKYAVPVADLLRQGRDKSRGSNHLSMIRFELMYRIFTECHHISLPNMGKRLGGFDHTSCLHGIRRYCKVNGLDYKALAAERAEANYPAALRRKPRAYSAIARMAEPYAQAMETARG